MFCPECGSWNRAYAVRCARCEVDLPELAEQGERPDEEIGALRRATGNRYRVLRRLGGGGMAHVYAAEHVALRRPVVVKVLHPHLARDPEMRERFRREAEAAARLTHPHIVAITDYGVTDETVYLMMPYCEGGSLADRLARERCMPAPVAAAIGAQVATALDFAHRHGVVHRDVKPDNILFDEDGNALVTDFGIATARFHGRLTGTGRAMGTPHYMSPEQAMGKMVDGRSDVYAVSYKHVHENPVPIEQAAPGVPPSLGAVVTRCLAKPADERYQRGVELADALLATLTTTRGDAPRAALLSRAPSRSTSVT